MFKYILVLCLFIIGCSSDKQPAKTPLKTQELSSALPQSEWKLIAKDNWSFEVPKDYINGKKPGDNVDVVLESPNGDVAIFFSAEPVKEDLMTYAGQFVEAIKTYGGQVVATLSGKISDRKSILIVFVVKNVAVAHIITADDNNLYNFDCAISLTIPKAKAKVCSLVAKTLKIK